MTIPDAIELTEAVIGDANANCLGLAEYEVDALNLLTDAGKKIYLLQKGWREVPGDNGATEWLAPVTFTGKGHYFALEAAYALEADGEGIVAYATQELTGELLRANDVASMQAKEEAYIAETGHPHGTFPNY